jgi:hypothetical protein
VEACRATRAEGDASSSIPRTCFDFFRLGTSLPEYGAIWYSPAFTYCTWNDRDLCWSGRNTGKPRCPGRERAEWLSPHKAVDADAVFDGTGLVEVPGVANCGKCSKTKREPFNL